MPKGYISLTNLLSITDDDGTFTYKSRPIFLNDYTKLLANNLPLRYRSEIPKGSIVTGFVGSFTATGGDTADTLTMTVEGCHDPFDVKTTTTADLTNSGTTLSVASRTGLNQYENLLLVASDLSSKEWVRQTDAAETGAGDKTITRGILGTTGVALTSGGYVLAGRSWQTLVTNDGTTTTVTTGAVDVSAAADAATVKGEVTSEELDLDMIAFPAIRVTLKAGGTVPLVDAKAGITLVYEF